MKKLFKYIVFAFGACVLLYACVLSVYNIKEPLFSAPIKATDKEMPIRNDGYGDGYFEAKRRNGRLHAGIDIASRTGTPVLASKSGLAVCKDLKKGYGKLIIIYHLDFSETRYAHLLKFNIKKLQWVGQGGVIGFVGKSGNAGYRGMQPHLHFEIRKGGKPLDPMRLLKY